MKAKTVVLSLAAAFCLLTTSKTWGKVIYVDDDAPTGGDGVSWTMAYRFLQDALGKAEAWDEIRVAQGIYKPDRSSAHPDGTGDRNASFCLLDGVAIRGGFAGVAMSDPDARDVVSYETILSGDLMGDDVSVLDPCDLLTEPTRADNSSAIVKAWACSRSTILDGFTITSGYAMGPHDRVGVGAGLYLSGTTDSPCCPSIRNCTFLGNLAAGGGLWLSARHTPSLLLVRSCKMRPGTWEGRCWFRSSIPHPPCVSLTSTPVSSVVIWRGLSVVPYILGMGCLQSSIALL